MLEGKSIIVVVPCYNEEKLISRVVSTMPEFIDKICVIDDSSTDATKQIVKDMMSGGNERLVLIEVEKNQGVGGSIAEGYKYAKEHKFDCAVVMAGDAQMDPDDLLKIVTPVIRGECDYSKGNRLFTGDAWSLIPRVRYIGNSMMSLLTKIASGYWHVADSQSGYTAANLKVLQTIKWDKMYKRYGQPNDLLVKLNIYNFRVRDVPIKPVYGVGEESGVKPFRMIPKLFWLLCRLFAFRMMQKYFIRDFHPLLFFYAVGLILFPSGIAFGGMLVIERVFVGPVAPTSALFSALFVITGVQFLLFGMWFDMENNKHLR